MSYQIKRSNTSVVVVERWYVSGVQKERHVMTIEPYTTPERLHELQGDFKGAKSRMPKKTYRERKDRIVRLSESDIEHIKESLETTKRYQRLESEKEKHKAVTKRISKMPITARGKMSERAAVMKYGSEELKRKRGYIK